MPPFSELDVFICLNARKSHVVFFSSQGFLRLVCEVVFWDAFVSSLVVRQTSLRLHSYGIQ